MRRLRSTLEVERRDLRVLPMPRSQARRGQLRCSANRRSRKRIDPAASTTSMNSAVKTSSAPPPPEAPPLLLLELGGGGGGGTSLAVMLTVSVAGPSPATPSISSRNCRTVAALTSDATKLTLPASPGVNVTAVPDVCVQVQ